MYKIPESLPQDINRFGTLAKGYIDKSVSPVEFKAFRVPMGVYEQRKNEVYMSRIRATGGFITPEQLISVINIAQANGSNLLHLTTRQEIQILNLDLEKVETVLNELHQAGLATKGGGGNTVRNIMVSEFSGIIGNEPFDATPYAMALTSSMVGEQDSYLMPRKMKIAFSSDDKNIDYAGINDVGLVAKIRDGKKGFEVYLGGGAGSRPSAGWKYSDFLPAEDLYALVKALKRFFSDYGNRKDKYKARIRFIFYKYGEEETFRLFQKYFDEVKAEGKQLEVVDFGNERPQNNYKPASALPTEESKAYDLWKSRYVTSQKQEGYASVLIPEVWGNIWLDQDGIAEGLKKVLAFVSQFGPHTVRFTNTQNIRLRNIPTAALPELYLLVKAFNTEIDKPLLANNIISCTGADTCRLGICFSKGLAGAIRNALLKSGLDLDSLSDVSIHVSGCPNSCGQQLWTDLGFSGKVLHNDRAYPAYQIYAGASRKRNPQLAEAVDSLSARDIPQFVVRIIKAYLKVENDFADFNAFLRSEAGKAEMQKLIDSYKIIPSFAEDKNYYFDWNAEEIFNVTKRGKPECSAGLFDMIQVDLDSIKENKDPNTYQVIFHAARMLLVTRGLDPATPNEVFDAFIEHFITPAYVDAQFKALIEKAKAEGEKGDYASLNAQANALADAVTELYQGMDESLQFKKPAQAASAEEPTVAAPIEEKGKKAEEPKSEPAKSHSIKIDRQKDLRGVLCPMNFVRTKLELASLQSGEILEIWLDDGKPIENVPGSVKLEGHTILLQEQESEGYWRVIIKKK